MYNYQYFNTILGEMLAIADSGKLFILEFINNQNIDEIKNKFAKKFNINSDNIKSQPNSIIDKTFEELNLYFINKLKNFTIPINLPCSVNTDFQNKVLKNIKVIRHGQTISYSKLAVAVNQPNAYRAVANACGHNDLTLIIPCHRVIAANNKLGGYSAGTDKKIWLLNHEKISVNQKQ